MRKVEHQNLDFLRRIRPPSFKMAPHVTARRDPKASLAALLFVASSRDVPLKWEVHKLQERT